MKVRFLKVNAFSMHDGIAHCVPERKEKMMGVSGVVNGYVKFTSNLPTLQKPEKENYEAEEEDA